MRDGAVLTLSSEDVIEHLAPMIGRAPSPVLREPDNAPPHADIGDANDQPPTNAQDRLLEAIGPVPVSIDEIVRHTGLPVRVVATLLLELDLAGRLERHSGGAVSLVLGDR